MIANSEINENGIIFSDSFLVVPAAFVKNQLPSYPLPFLENFIGLQKRGRRIVKQEDSSMDILTLFELI